MTFQEYHNITEKLIKQIALAQIAEDLTLSVILNKKLETISNLFLNQSK